MYMNAFFCYRSEVDYLEKDGLDSKNHKLNIKRKNITIVQKCESKRGLAFACITYEKILFSFHSREI